MAFASLSRARRVASAPPRLAKVRHRNVKPGIASEPGFIGSAPRLGAALSSLPPVIQTKLQVGAPNDKFEREADRVADQIMRMADPQRTRPIDVNGRLALDGVQRMCAECKEEVRRQTLEDEEEELQLKRVPGAIPKVGPGLQSQISGLLGGGRPLSVAERAFFEPRFGHDFRQVRLHSDTQAAESARAIHARAFTIGRNIVLGDGEYSPHTLVGQHLLAHELTHVVQQSRGNAGGVVQRAPSVSGWIFNTSQVSADNCAAAATHKGLGPDSQFYSSQAQLYPSLQGAVTNGMELKAIISGHAAGTTYDLKRVIGRNSWQRDRAADPWDPVLGQHKPSGTTDDPNDLDECRVPIAQPHLSGTTVAVYSLDHPGLNPATLRAAATQGVYKATFTESVEITDAQGTRIDPRTTDWHSSIWLEKDAQGNWNVESSETEISLGSIAVTAPPASAAPPSVPGPPPEFVEPPQ